jgi:hypothetical protein
MDFPRTGEQNSMKTFRGFSITVGVLAGLVAVVSQRGVSRDLTDTNIPAATPQPSLVLDEVLSSTINTRASARGKQWNYPPFATSLGINHAVWTWPVNLSCVGMASDSYQATLIAPDKLLTCGHYAGEQGKSVQFHDTNGKLWTGYVSNVVYVVADMCISLLSNAAPASIVIPAILPPDVTDYLPNHSLVGLPAFWVHKNGANGSNGGTIQYDPVVQVAEANGFGGRGTWMWVRHNGFGPFGNGASATGGDSGSPAFMMFSNTPVLLFAATTPGDAAGMFVSGPLNFAALAAGGYTNGMNILDLRGFKKYP